jgi:hypothetical protein
LLATKVEECAPRLGVGVSDLDAAKEALGVIASRAWQRRRARRDLQPADAVTLTAPQIVICPSQPMTPKKRRRGIGAAALKVSGNGAKEIDIAVGGGKIGQTRTRNQAPVPKLRREIL